MITERDIAEKFSVIWKQHFPMLTPNYMRVFNEAQILPINTNPIPKKDDVRYDLISELAFNLSYKSYNEGIDINNFQQQDSAVVELVKETARAIWKSGNYSDSDLNLSEIEFEEAILISKNTIEFIEKIKQQQIQFKPTLKGFGSVPDLIADISIDDSLFEVKTVNRNFRSSDLKQLFIYLALRQVENRTNWIYGGLYNPRRGVYCKFNIKNLSGGKSTNEAFENLLNSLSRDVQIDSKF